MPFHTRFLLVPWIAGALLSQPVVAQSAPSRGPGAGGPADGGAGPAPGLLVMAHGGSEAWNAAVAAAVQPLRARLPTALAFGMADPTTLRSALDSLAEAGVGRVAVVRLFMSGASFLHETEYFLGLRSDPPSEVVLHAHGPHDAHGAPGGGGAGVGLPTAHGMEILLSRGGLGESPLAGRILVERAHRLSRVAAEERVILLAHGMGDDDENSDVLGQMRGPATTLREMGFSEVHFATLREDWPEARKAAEAEIRRWVAEGSSTGRRTLVVPYRLAGFGPYAEVLEGLVYEPTEGLLPHPLVTTWIEEEASSLLCAAGAPEGSACRRRILGG